MNVNVTADRLAVPVERTHRTVELCAGPGGWLQGARILGVDLDAEGIELAADPIATARAAGHRRRQADVFTVSPDEYPNATGLIASSPCPTFSIAGTRSGISDYQNVLDVWIGVGWGVPPAEALNDLRVADPRTALLAVAGVWAMTMPNLTWLAFEQVPDVEFAFEDLAAELYAAGWEWADVAVLDAQDFGVPSRRRRTFLVARRYSPGRLLRSLPVRHTMAEVLGWKPGHKVFTRGNRVGGGGNAYSADQPSWCLTSKARAWYRDDGLKLTTGEAGYLSGFPMDYPWTGSRSSAFQQSGDVVSPVVAAAVLGAAVGVDARQPILDHMDALYVRDRDLALSQG